MKAFVIAQAGGPEVLDLKEIPAPIPQKGQALIAIKALGLNRAEAVTRIYLLHISKWIKMVLLEK